MKMKQDEQKKIEQAFYVIGASLFGFALILYLLYKMFPIPLGKYLLPCMFQKFTGLYCPGCGGTRAAAALIQGKWLLSFFYHPIVPYTAVIYLWYMISHSIQYVCHDKIKIGMHYRDAYLWTALVLVATNFLIKNGVLLIYHQDILETLKQYW